LLFLVVFASTTRIHAEEKLRVGAIFALTGPVSIQGVPMKNAMQMAKEEFDRQHELEIFYEDDAFQAKNAVSAAQRLLDEKQVQVLVAFGTQQGFALAPIAERRKIPFFAVNVNPKTVAGKKYTFLLMPSLVEMTELNIAEAKRRGYKNLALVSTQHDACLAQSEIIAAEKAFKVKTREELIAQSSEIREQAARIATRKPDAVFLSTIAPHGSLISKRLRELGFAGDFFGGIQLANLAEARASSGALDLH
jgi:branched-chain amino acid transport system substrate-binding protein